MAVGRMIGAAFLACMWVQGAWGQDCVSGEWNQESPSLRNSSLPASISLIVPAGTILQVALHKDVRVKKVGQDIAGIVVYPVYAFDREVIPVGSEVVGRISKIQGPSKKKRLLAALNLDFTPTRKVEVEFKELVLPEGKRIPLAAGVTRGSGKVLRLVTTADAEKKKPSTDQTAEKKTSPGWAEEKMKEAVRGAKEKWQAAVSGIKKPGRMRRVGRFLVAQLPVHPQYVQAGTVYFAELQEPLDFGSQPPTPQPQASNNTAPPCALLAHVQLLSPLSSATTKKDAPVEAILTHPIFSGDQLLFPQGSLLKGSVVQAQPARRLGRNGNLRIAFNELVPPGGLEQKVDTTLEGVQAGKDARVKLDTEGGAKARPPKTRYISTGVTSVLAMMSHDDTDSGVYSESIKAKEGILGGAAGFKLVGIAVGSVARSRSLSLGMGLYGVGWSVYADFLARGTNLELPKGTALEVGLWLRRNCKEFAKPEGTDSNP